MLTCKQIALSLILLLTLSSCSEQKENAINNNATSTLQNSAIEDNNLTLNNNNASIEDSNNTRVDSNTTESNTTIAPTIPIKEEPISVLIPQTAIEEPIVTPQPEPVLPTPSAFNIVDETTYVQSTCTPLLSESVTGYFASPTGRANALGTLQDPLALQNAIGENSPLQAGDKLWLLEGLYSGAFVSKIRGTSALPIQIRPLRNARVVLDGRGSNASALRIDGQWVEYYGLEIASSSTARVSQERGSSPSDISGNSGMTIFAANTLVANCIIHDNLGGGISSWRTSGEANSELYGNIIYNNGWTAPDRGHGHAIYIQNRSGYKKMTNNIIFFGFATGIHAYTEGGQINNFDIEENVWFMTGASDPRSSQKKDNCLVGGFQPVKNLLLKNNIGYSENGRGTRIGYGGSVVGQDAVLENNYLSENFWVAGEWDSLTLSNTTILRGRTGSSQSFVTDLGDNTFEEQPPVSGKKVFVQANAYDPLRARVAIFNNDEDDTIDVDLSAILQEGEAYRVHSVFDLFGAPMFSGVYDGNLVAFSMGSVTPPQPRGMIDGIEESDDPHKRFGVFIVTHGGCQ